MSLTLYENIFKIRKIYFLINLKNRMYYIHYLAYEIKLVEKRQKKKKKNGLTNSFEMNPLKNPLFQNWININFTFNFGNLYVLYLFITFNITLPGKTQK